MSSPPLLVTKITPPPLRGNLVGRPQLFARLDEATDKKLILVAATAGFGKTTLIAHWSQQQDRPVCWLALDASDNDPIRFLAYLIAAIQAQFPDFGQAILTTLQLPQPPKIDVILPSLVNQLATLNATSVAGQNGLASILLILDDLHLITNPDIHQGLTFLLTHLPPQIRLVLLSRSDPPLALGRLRASNELLELRTADLRFSLAEATTFLNNIMGLQLTEDLISQLETRTEGWAAGLQLAALALQNQGDDAETLVRQFSGSHRFVLDYLVEEVLAQQPEDVRRFLLQTAVLHRLNSKLCDAILEQHPSTNSGAASQQMLAHLAQNNLFLLPLDQVGAWYRYHHLFADLLLARLAAEDKTAVSTLQKRAARWHEQQGHISDAIDYALAAADYDHATELLNAHMNTISQRGETATLITWHNRFPAEHLATQPRLAVQFGLAFGTNGRWQTAEKLLALAKPYENELPTSESLLLAYLVASNRQDMTQLEKIATRAASLPQQDSFALIVLGLINSILGNQQAACHWATQAYELSQREGNLMDTATILFHLGRLLLFRGSLHEAHELCQTTLATYAQPELAPLATVTHVSLGRIFLEWLDFEQAEHHLRTTIGLAERSGFVTGILSSTTMLLAEVKQMSGEADLAQQLAAKAIGYAKRFDPPTELPWLELSQVQLWLRQGKVGTAVRWQQEQEKRPWVPSMFYLPQFRTLVEARLLLAQQRVEAAIERLVGLTAVSPSLYTPSSFALLALARHAQGNSSHAELALTQALDLAQAENRRFPFLALGQPMQTLLTQSSHPFAQTLLPGFPKSKIQNPKSEIPAFTPREQDVLRLIAAGHTNKEIATTLTLAPSTVKWYINTLYSKLHVQNRRQAIARTQQLGLFTDH
ncbi:MAG: LuxR C-terminal-related transcriptional regulator [Chloroflexota bacterium]